MAIKEFFSASLVTQGEHKFYTLTLPVDIIALAVLQTPVQMTL